MLSSGGRSRSPNSGRLYRVPDAPEFLDHTRFLRDDAERKLITPAGKEFEESRCLGRGSRYLCRKGRCDPSKLTTPECADDDCRVEHDPPDARQVDCLVALLDTVDEPQTGRKQIGAPGQWRNAYRLRAGPDRPDLRHRHEHRHDGEDTERFFQSARRCARPLRNRGAVCGKHRHVGSRSGIRVMSHRPEGDEREGVPNEGAPPLLQWFE